jgi:CspA family cold shock protein
VSINVETGRVSWFSDRRGFGFITPDTGGANIFIHYKDIDIEGWKTLAQGDSVSYEIEPTSKGPKCVRVRVLSACQQAS